ncbi:MAG: Type III restriction enzyme, res subunit [Candidatus Argoarchaeum ethanivorans]|uniref:Type III restriction enzyme, res subunit n=1 Tax=Candidatus Argoarchaeum ethanivorans TaxID=2608793 RepID=A0A812A258_9EURY|nr:MAG: Type III restriction enzyme, res subunit [Candidatus Argoarchaeum ethanivorans]
MFKDLNLLPVYDSSEHSIVDDLLVPLLESSVSYIRGVGYFTSGWLRNASKGIVQLVENGGKVNFVVSPLLEKSDWQALKVGERAKTEETLKSILSQSIQNLSKSLEYNTRNALSWMVADGVLEFKFAIPKSGHTDGDYHDKVGVFFDKNNDIVAIHGSFNDTIKGSLNGEAFSVFKSWEPGQLPYVKIHQNRLQKLLSSGNQQFNVFSIPEANKNAFIKLRDNAKRPYNLVKHATCEVVDVKPSCPFELFDYQKLAIDKWEKANFVGILEMATGTGKTITSLSAAINRYEKNGSLLLVILVPFLHLLEQWELVCNKFGILPILCSSTHKNWNIKIKSKLQDFNLGTIDFLCIVSVHQTASKPKFSKSLSKITFQNSLLIADEVHYLGTSSLKHALLPTIKERIGLSATPERWYDEIGTSTLFKYFSSVCFKFPLEEAIGSFLTPYKYFPIIIHLSENEISQYEYFSKKISHLCPDDNSIDLNNEELKRLLIRRSLLLANAEGKIPKLLDILRTKYFSDDNLKDFKHALIYCAPGSHREVLQQVSNLNITCHEFVHQVNIRKRNEVLRSFDKGDIQVIVAIKCLDEGVDIPATRTAFFLSSTTNPKEFIQRRGRVLRKSKGKDFSEIYDFIIAPNIDSETVVSDAYKSILKREMPRFAEFSSAALNEYESRSQLYNILDKYEMLDLIDKKPWEIFHKLRKAHWNINEEQ